MADTNEIAGVPLGAQILRKLHGGLRTLGEEVTKMAGSLDECEAKSVIGNMVGGIGSTTGEIEKMWGKYYKDHDINASDATPVDEAAKAVDPDGDGDDDTGGEDADIDAALEALGDLGDDDDKGMDEDDDMSPDEKRLVLDRIKKLEATTRHLERLERQAAARS